MKPELIKSLLAHAQGEIAYHKANVHVYLNNPVGIGEHPDLAAAVDSQIELIAHAEDKINVLTRYYDIGKNPYGKTQRL